MAAKRPTRPAPASRATVPATPPTTPDEGAHEIAPRYRVLSGGISTPGGAIYRGALVTGGELVDGERVRKLLDLGSIEAVAND